MIEKEKMKYLHTMISVQNLDSTLNFFIEKLGIKEVRRNEVSEGEFTLVFLVADDNESQLELTYNWDNNDPYSGGDNFGHVTYSVENIYDYFDKLGKKGVTILRPQRDGKMAFIRSRDRISIELLQQGDPLPIHEPLSSMKNRWKW